jgi:hypothetical protein
MIQRSLTSAERETLSQFARLEISLDELRSRLSDVLDVDFGPTERRLSRHFLLPEPGIRIEKDHIRNALDKHSKREISVGDISAWARCCSSTMSMIGKGLTKTK